VTDRVRVAAALLASRMARGRLASPFTAREVYRNDWTGLTEPRVLGEALECLRELGWIRPEAVMARDGGRPTVRFHINPRVAQVGEVLSVLSVGIRGEAGANRPAAARPRPGLGLDHEHRVGRRVEAAQWWRGGELIHPADTAE
jgi:hypothetical protein